jgi:hypothetical protein
MPFNENLLIYSLHEQLSACSLLNPSLLGLRKHKAFFAVLAAAEAQHSILGWP